MRPDFKLIEAVSEAEPASWHPSWAPVINDMWANVLDAEKVESPVAVMVTRLRKMANQYVVTKQAPGLQASDSAESKGLSYKKYFR